MTNDRLASVRAALAPLWELNWPAADVHRHPAFIRFKNYCQQTFPAADSGLGFAFGLADALRGAGLPCMMTEPAESSPLDDGARAILDSFEATTIRRRYLCPLDLADALPALRFGTTSLCQPDRDALAALFDAPWLARHFPKQTLELDRLAQFQWLIVEEDVPAPPRAGQRAMPFFYRAWSQDLGAIDPHAGSHPDPVTDALFGLLLAPWEEWHSHEYDWRGFSIPWIHVATDDLFVRPRPVPSADTLTWEDAAYEEYDGEFIEYERPVQVHLDDAGHQLSAYDDTWWGRIEAAQATSLFETPVKHFLVRAAFSEGMDQVMAHMTAIEAALGLRSDFQNKGRPKGTRMSPSDRVAKRVELLLGDRQAGNDYAALFETRSAFVHGRSIQGPVPGKDRNRARQLARRVVVALMDAANSSAGTSPRESYLNSLA
jgi:hypothetical protein